MPRSLGRISIPLVSIFGLSIVVSTIAFAPTLRAQTDRDSRPPNIVLFHVDDLGWTDLGCMGSDYYETPNVDRLARDGMLFTDAYANAPNCAPSRACLMSGLYSPRHGVYTVGRSDRGRARLRKVIPTPNRTDLDERFVTMAEMLKSAGYRTAHVGKWHLGADPTRQGFDVNAGGNTTGSPKGGYFSPWKNPELPNIAKGEYLTDRLTREAVEFVQRNRRRPFFLHLAHYAVHTPIQAPKDLVDRYRVKSAGKHHSNPAYAAMIDAMDRSLGEICKALRDADVADDTIVVFFSDNGGHGPVTSQRPLRGGKGMLYEGGIRVPMIVRWPMKVASGTRCSIPVIGTDLYPTFAQVAGVRWPVASPLDGESLVGLLTGATNSLDRDAIYWHFPAYLQRAGRQGPPFRTRPAAAIRRGRWKLIEFFEDGRLELYDLVDDIGESKNVANSRPEVVALLRDHLAAWRERVQAPIPTLPNPVFRR